MKTRALHGVIGGVMLLPLTGSAVTGAVFFLKPGSAAAYEALQVKGYSYETEVRLQPDPSWIEPRFVKTILGEHSPDWKRLGLSQRGPDTDRIDALYRIHSLQWTGEKAIDRVLERLASLAVSLSALGARLFPAEVINDRKKSGALRFVEIAYNVRLDRRWNHLAWRRHARWR